MQNKRFSFLKQPFPFVKQLDTSDCGIACLKMICRYYGGEESTKVIQGANVSKKGVLFSELKRLTDETGFNSLAVKIDLIKFRDNSPLPAIFLWEENHYVVVYKITNRRVYFVDPAIGRLNCSYDEFCEGWHRNTDKGLALVLLPTKAFQPQEKQTKLKNIRFTSLLSYLVAYRKELILVSLTLLFVSLIDIIFPFFTKKIIDQGVNYKDTSLIQLILCSQVFLFFGKISNEFYRSWLFIHVSSRVSARLISDFLLKLVSLPIKFFSSKNVGDLLERIADHKRVESFLTNDLLKSVFAAVSVIVYAAILVYFDTKIFLIFFIGNVLQLSWIFIFLKQIRVIDHKQFTLLTKEQNKILELINGMQEIKLNNIQNDRKSVWEENQIELFKNNVKKLQINQKYESYRFISFFISVFVTFSAANSVIEGNLTLGGLTAIVFILGGLNVPISQLINFILNYQLVKVSLERIDQVYGLESEVSEEGKVEPVFGDIEISNLSYAYDNANYILSNINLTIPWGKTTAIVGVSGSGKTTLLKLLLKFYTPQKGGILINGCKIEEIDNGIWRNQCGVIFQDSFLFSESIAYNISMDRNYDKNKLNSAITSSNIRVFIDSLPLGIDTIIGAEGIGLSQGQKQRILIARAIYKNPQYLFFDEATNSLDTENESIIVKNIEKLFKKRTMIIVAHRLSTVKNADQIIVFNNGSVIENGSHLDLIKNEGLYYNLVKNQLELNN